MEKSCENYTKYIDQAVIIYLLCGFFIALPVLWASNVLEGFDIHLTRLIILSVGIFWLVSSLYRRNFLLPRGSIAFLGLSFFIWIHFSLMYSDVPTWTLRKLIFVYSFLPLVFVLYHGLRQMREKGLLVLGKSVVLGGVVSSIVGIFQFFAQFIVGRDAIAGFWMQLTPFFLGGTFSESVSEYNSWYVHIASIDVFRSIAFFPDPHIFAFFTAMIAPLALYVYSETKNKKWIFFFGMIICANLLTLSRGGEVGILTGFVVGLVIFWHKVSIIVKHILFSIVVLTILSFFIPQNPLVERFISSFAQEDNSNTARIEIWADTISIWKEHPFIGVGLGAYPVAVDPLATYRIPIYAHNLYLDILVEFGIVGLLLFLIFLSRMIYVFAQSRTLLGSFAIMSLSAFLAHGLFDTPFFSVHILPLIFFFVALAMYYESRRIQN